MPQSELHTLLSDAWNLRERLGIFQFTEAVRVFHGPGESGKKSIAKNIAVDRFKDHYWVTEWSDAKEEQPLSSKVLETLVAFYREKKAQSLVLLRRPEKGELPTEPQVIWGEAPTGRFPVKEYSNTF